MWFLHKEVILTEDNFIKRKWHGCTKCYFCDQDDTIKHLFFSYPFTRILWRIIYMTFNLPPPSNISNMFRNWLNGIAKKKIKAILELVCTLYYGLYGLSVIFLSLTKKCSIILHVIPLLTHWASVVLPAASGGPLGHGYWVQPFGDGSTGFL
jgi:hypothetical protein